MQHNMRLYYIFAFISFLMSFLGLCPSPLAASMGMEKIVEEAKKEGEVFFYTSMNIEDANPIISRFEKKYPFLKVRLTRTDSGKILTKVLTETRARRYGDVIQTVAFSMYSFGKLGILGHYLPAEDHLYPKDFKGQGYWTCSYYQPYVAVYNTKLVARHDIPKTYEDLLTPRWKKRMMLEGSKVDWFAGMLQIMGRERGIRFMRDLAQQQITLHTGHSLIAQLVAAGEAELDINIPFHSVMRIKDKGAPMEGLALGPVPGIMIGIGMTSQAPHPQAAKLFVDFVLSHEVQSMLRDRFSHSVIRSDIALTANYPISQVVPINPALADSINEYAKLLREIFPK